LLGRTPKQGDDDLKASELAGPLLGKEMTMRYAQREAAPAGSAGGSSGAAYSVVSRELKLTIVGVADLDPESMRGPTRAKVFLPLKLTESLHVIQPTDLREMTSSGGNEPVYSSISVRVKDPKHVESVETAIKKMGFSTFSILDASRGLRQFFAVLYAFL